MTEIALALMWPAGLAAFTVLAVRHDKRARANASNESPHNPNRKAAR